MAIDPIGLSDIGARAVALHLYKRRVEARRHPQAGLDPELQFQQQLLERQAQALADLIDRHVRDNQLGQFQSN